MTPDAVAVATGLISAARTGVAMPDVVRWLVERRAPQLVTAACAGEASSNFNAYIHVVLEVSHDGTHWHELGIAGLDTSHRTVGWPSDLSVAIAWPARYVRAKILRWTEAVTGGSVWATIASR